MSEQSKKIVTPPFLLRRLEAFRIVKGDEQSYLLRDKIQGKTYDFDLWQFFILEVLQGCETVEKLQSVFHDRFDRKITKAEIDALFGSIADNKLFDEAAETHPLLAPFMRRTYEVEGGKAKPKPFTGAETSARAVPATTVSAAASSSPAASAAGPAPAPKPALAAAAGGPPTQPQEMPAGVEDALGMDWKTTDKMWALFDPGPMLKVIGPVLRPLHYLVYPIPLLMLAALFVTFQYSNILIPDLYNLKAQVSLFEHLAFVFVSVHVVTTLTAAVMADAYKVKVDTVGVFLTLGFMPRWVLKMTGAERLSRKQTMWLHGSTLLARMAMYSLGALLWYTTRDSHSDLPQIGLLFMFSCGIGLLFESGNPFIKANGYFLLSAYLNEPHLRGKAYAALMNKFRGGVYKAADSNLLALYALLSSTYVLFVIFLVAWVIVKFVFTEISLGGSGVIITLAFVGWMLWKNYEGLKKFGQTYERQVQFDRWRNRTLPAGVAEGEVITKTPSYWGRAITICLLLALFLPYPYEPSGAFTVYPVQKGDVSTDSPGLVAAVYFDGGEAVGKGTVVARLDHEEYQSQIQVLDAEIDEQKHVIANLKTLPKPEEVQVAMQQLEVARSQVPFSGDKVQRLTKIYPTGAITLEELETAKKQFEQDKAQVVEKEAALALVKAGPTAEQIAAAESKLVSLQNQRAGIVVKVDHTTIRMPFDGNILTLHLKDKLNSYLPAGQPFMSVENTGKVTAQIQVAEPDIQYVNVGQGVRIRPQSFFYNDFEGKVTLIDRNVTPKSFGDVVMVIATFDNKDGRLKTGMTGEAKVATVWMPVWRAFTQSITRFFRLQVWSWIP
jgi:putative peptide zinc metalloprotease protein